MSDRPSIFEIIENWDAENNGNFRGSDRPQLIRDLIYTIKEAGYKKVDIDGTVKAKIYGVTTSNSSKKHFEWKVMVEKELNRAIIAFYPNPMAQIKKAPPVEVRNDPAPRYSKEEKDVESPEEEQTTQNQETTQEQPVQAKVQEESGPIAVNAVGDVILPDHMRYGRALDLSKVHEPPKVIYNKELRKLLGYKDE